MVSIRTLALSLVVPLVSALTAQQIVQNIQTLTTKSQALQAPAQSINIVNGPLILIGQGPFPPIIAGFADIVKTATVSIAAMQASPDIITVESEATAIADAFRQFVAVHQALLNILIGKAGLFNTVPLIGTPVATALRGVEGVVDTIALGLISILEVGPQKSRVISDTDSLGGSLSLAIDVYSGIKISKDKVKREFIA